ncbi:hypothetical protein P4689_12125 [Priestia megaterium]|uniref:hypothetical protein n=1 Tax=Priestia megaterium TaxID=1404 RepID=UPI002E1D2C25|nr:hypothetical protein [Priestia megaterium]
MNSYILDTKFAASGLIDLISKEEKELQQLKNEHQKAEEELRNKQYQYEESIYNIEDNMEDMDVRQKHSEYLSYRQNVVKPLKDKITEITLSLEVKDASIRALCGALLQIAKQGISTVHRGLTSCPDGRNIGAREKLKNVIWQARNQSMHYEESVHRPYFTPVINCFHNLVHDFGINYTLLTGNLSKEIIELLQWKDYSDYEKDMVLLLG